MNIHDSSHCIDFDRCRMEERDLPAMPEVKIEIDVAEELQWTNQECSQGGYRSLYFVSE